MNSLGVQPKAEGNNPFTIVCYICGREYGSKSISIHETKCIEKFQAEQKKLPKEKRRALPKKPQMLPNLPDSKSQIVAGTALPTTGTTGTMPSANYNDAAFATYQEQSRVPCPTCGRKFAPDSFDKHARNCKPGGIYDTHKKREPVIVSKPSIKKASNPVLVETTITSIPNTETNTNTATVFQPFCAHCGYKCPDLVQPFCASCGGKRQ